MTKITVQCPIVFIVTACTQTSDTACIQITADDLPSQVVFPISKVLLEYKGVTYTQCEDISLMYAKSDTGYIVALHIGDDVFLYDDNTYSVNINASQSINKSMR